MQKKCSAYLIEAVLATVRNVDDLHDDSVETDVEEIALVQLLLELGRACQHEAGNIHLVRRDELLRSQLCHFANIVVPLLETKARETQRGLTTTSVLLRQLHAELVQDLRRARKKRDNQICEKQKRKAKATS